MGNQVFGGFVYDACGNPVNGAVVDLYTRNSATSSTSACCATASTTSNACGFWTISTATEGRFDVRIKNSCLVLWRKYDDQVQLERAAFADIFLRNPANTFDYQLAPAAIAADRVLTLPLITGADTIPAIGLAQTWTATQTFGTIAATADLTIDPTASTNITLTDDDADALDAANSATSYYLIDTRNTVSGVLAHAFDTEDATVASAGGAIYTLASFNAHTLTYTGTTQVTSLVPTNTFLAQTITDACAVIVDKATTVQVVAPTEAGSVTLAAASALRVLNASGTPTTQYGIFIEDLTSGATSDYGIWIAGADTAAIAIASADPLQLGVAGAATGTMNWQGATSGTVNMTVAAAAGCWTLTLPTDNGTCGQILTTNGCGVSSWTTAAGSALSSTRVTFSRTAAAGAGCQNVTGAGFTPTAAYFVAAECGGSTDAASYGFVDDGGLEQAVSLQSNCIVKILRACDALHISDGTNRLSATAALISCCCGGVTLTWTKGACGLNVHGAILFLR